MGSLTYVEFFHLLDVITAVLGCRGVRKVDRHALEEFALLYSIELQMTGIRFSRIQRRSQFTSTHLAFLMRATGILPITTSIIAKCSKLSCVWNRASPVKNSTRMHPTENMSQGKLHPRPKIDLALSIPLRFHQRTNFRSLPRMISGAR